jgi:hypothetical protein
VCGAEAEQVSSVSKTTKEKENASKQHCADPWRLPDLSFFKFKIAEKRQGLAGRCQPIDLR